MFRWMKRKWGARGPGSRTEKRPGSGSWGHSQGTWRQNVPCKNWSSWRPPGASAPSAARCRTAICGTQDWDLLRHWWKAGNWEPRNRQCIFLSIHSAHEGKKLSKWKTLPGSAFQWSPRNEKQRIWRHMWGVQREANTRYPQYMWRTTPWLPAPSRGQGCLSLASSWSARVKDSHFRNISGFFFFCKSDRTLTVHDKPRSAKSFYYTLN